MVDFGLDVSEHYSLSKSFTEDKTILYKSRKEDKTSH